MQRQKLKAPKIADRRESRKALFSEIMLSARTMPVRSLLFALQFSKKMLTNDMRAMGKADSEKSLRHQRRLSRSLAKLRAGDSEYDEQERNRILLLAVKHYVNMFYKLGPKQRGTYTSIAGGVFSKVKAENNLLLMPSELAARGMDRSKVVDMIYSGIIDMPIKILYDSCKAALDVELLQSRMGIKEVPEGSVNTIKESMDILYENFLTERPHAANASEVTSTFVNDIIEASEETGLVVPYFIAYRFSAESAMDESMRKMARKAASFDIRV